MPFDPTQWHSGLVGHGEVGRGQLENLRPRGGVLSAFDLKRDSTQAAAQHTPAAVQVASDRFGVALATSMGRNVTIKGLEARVIESFATARHPGVEDAAPPSLNAAGTIFSGRSHGQTNHR